MIKFLETKTNNAITINKLKPLIKNGSLNKRHEIINKIKFEEKDSLKTNFCLQCSHKLSSSSYKFCTNCGYDLITDKPKTKNPIKKEIKPEKKSRSKWKNCCLSIIIFYIILMILGFIIYSY